MNGVNVNRKILCNIAHFAFEVVNDLLARDQLLSNKLRSHETSSRQIFREETITELLVTSLVLEFPQYIDLVLFTQREETWTGADWYWRVERGNDAIHARVQAKRVHRATFGQPDEDGYIDVNLQQLDDLLEATRKDTQKLVRLEAWLATYARYHRYPVTPPCGCHNLLGCEYHYHAEVCTNSQPSLWIANAQEIASSRIQQASIEQIVQHSVRLDCILPCIDASGASGPHKKGFMLQGGLQSYEECVTTIANDPQLRSEFKGALRIHL